MQAFQALIDGFKAILQGDPTVVDVTANGAGITVLTADDAAASAIRAKHPRYRGMPVYAKQAEGIRRLTFLDSIVYVMPEQTEVRAQSGAFMVVANRGEDTMWTSKLYVIAQGAHARPLGAIDLPKRKTLVGVLRSGGHAARAYVRVARRSLGPVRSK